MASHAAYHIALPANLPPAQDWVLNHRPHLRIHDAQDFVFDGNGSTLYFAGSTAGINVENNQPGIIENLTIDWGNPEDPNPAWRGPLFDAFGTIKKDSKTTGHIDFIRMYPAFQDLEIFGQHDSIGGGCGNLCVRSF